MTDKKAKDLENKRLSVDVPKEESSSLKQIINGRECLVVPLADYEVKGLE